RTVRASSCRPGPAGRGPRRLPRRRLATDGTRQFSIIDGRGSLNPMFFLPVISSLFTFIYLRPQEVFDLLRAVTMAWMVALVTVTWVLDVRVGVTRPRVSALMVLALVLFAYCLATVAIKAPDRMAKQ